MTLVGVGKSLMALSIFAVGLKSSLSMANPAKSTSVDPKTSLLGLKITPWWAHWKIKKSQCPRPTEVRHQRTVLLAECHPRCH